MKRWIFKLVVFLLLGAIINVGVCWIVATRAIPHEAYLDCWVGSSDIGERGFWHFYRINEPARDWVRSWWGFNVSMSLMRGTYLPAAHEVIPKWSADIEYLRPGKINDADIVAQASGWPYLGMSWHYTNGYQGQDETGRLYAPVGAHGIVVHETGDLDRRLLPIRPIWPGFALNMLVYATLAWLLFSGPFRVRRLIRRKRGHCLKCGYDLRGASGGGGEGGCPECGWRREEKVEA